MKGPKPVDSKTAKQLFICGQIMGIQMKQKAGQHVNPGELEAELDQVDISLLEAYLKTKPEGFKYTENVREVIKMASARN